MAEAACESCKGAGVIERLATPEEVDAGCELGVAFDRCPNGACPFRALLGPHVCDNCEQPIEAAWWRFRCGACGRVIHYGCIEGGAPVVSMPSCPRCGGSYEALEKHSDDRQGSLFG